MRRPNPVGGALRLLLAAVLLGLPRSAAGTVRDGAAATGHPLATQAGLAAFARGGNAARRPVRALRTG
jgi:gamma-glutamyltranspeptidase